MSVNTFLHTKFVIFLTYHLNFFKVTKKHIKQKTPTCKIPSFINLKSSYKIKYALHVFRLKKGRFFWTKNIALSWNKLHSDQFRKFTPICSAATGFFNLHPQKTSVGSLNSYNKRAGDIMRVRAIADTAFNLFINSFTIFAKQRGEFLIKILSHKISFTGLHQLYRESVENSIFFCFFVQANNIMLILNSV